MQSLRRSDVRDLLRHAALPGMISLAGGLPAAECFDVTGLREAAQAALCASPEAALQYGETEGDAGLRAAIAAALRAEGAAIADAAPLITAGSQQGIDLVARALIDPGDTVVVERPSYLAALQAFGLAQAQWASIAVDEEGARIEDLDLACAGVRPRLLYLVPDFANPTGATLSLARRHAVLDWAVRHQVVVFEDDPYGALRFEGTPLPTLHALAQTVPGAAQWVVRASTLSKTVAPGLRVGWLLAPPWLREALVRIKQATDLQTGSLTQAVAREYLRSGRQAAPLDRVCVTYRARRDALMEALAQTFGDRLVWNAPAGGLFVWARFVDGTDTRALLAAAIERGVTFVPGDAFYVDQADRSLLRLNFSACAPERLREGVSRLAAAHAAVQAA